MSTEELDPNEDKDSKLLAALCYFPIFGLSLFAPLYILLAHKGGKYAKFHAVQGLALLAVFFLIAMANFWIFFLFAGFPFAAPPAIQPGANPTAMLQTIQNWQLQMFQRMLPFMLIGLVEMVFSLFLSYRAFAGKGIALPVIKNLAAGHVKQK